MYDLYSIPPKEEDEHAASAMPEREVFRELAATLASILAVITGVIFLVIALGAD